MYFLFGSNGLQNDCQEIANHSLQQVKISMKEHQILASKFDKIVDFLDEIQNERIMKNNFLKLKIDIPFSLMISVKNESFHRKSGVEVI